MIEKARNRLKEYDLDAVSELGIARAGEHFGSSHTVVTYFPLNTLGRVSQDEVLSELSGDGSVNLYAHIPFCRSKCGYCSYVSEPNASGDRVEDYLSSLGQELAMYGDSLQGRTVSSVYLGGGTPTILSNQQLGDLFDSIYRTFDVEEGATVCVEANPVTLRGQQGQNKLATLVQNGVKRLSIGVQSFNDRSLKAIGRGYIGNEDARSAIVKAKEAGVNVVNVDMMQDLPGQTLHDIEADLEAIAELRPDSVTWYTMRVAPDCWLYQRQERVSEEDSLVARIMITERLKELGYTQTSGDRFCLGSESRDRFKESRSSVSSDMLGVGVSSYSHIGDLIFRNERDVGEYMKIVAESKLPVSEGKYFNEEERIIAQIVLGLKNGLDLNDSGKDALVGNRWLSWLRLSPDDRLYDLFQECGYRKKIPQLVDTGLLEFEGNKLQFTDKGRLFENEVCRMLYSPIVDAQTRGQRVRAFFKRFFSDSTPAGFRVRA